MVVFDIKKESHEIKVDSQKGYTTQCKGGWPHWGWLVFALVVFWPSALVWLGLGFFREYYHVQVDGKEIILDRKNFELLRQTFMES